jgi:hypothetical protein
VNKRSYPGKWPREHLLTWQRQKYKDSVTAMFASLTTNLEIHRLNVKHDILLCCVR